MAIVALAAFEEYASAIMDLTSISNFKPENAEVTVLVNADATGGGEVRVPVPVGTREGVVRGEEAAVA